MIYGPNFVRELIKKGAVENSIYELQRILHFIKDKRLKKDVSRSGELLSHNFNLTKWQYDMGVLSNEDWSAAQSRMANSILNILEAIEQDGKVSGSSSEQDRQIIQFSRIEIFSNACIWRSRQKRIDIECPLYDFHEQMGTDQPNEKCVDPIFDILLLNQTSSPVIINQLGIIPISARSDIKGIPTSGIVKIVEGYTLKIKDFTFGKDEIITLKDPVYLEGEAPFRFTLKLEGYKKAAKKKGNDTVIKFLIGANNQRLESPLIKMGMY